MSELIFALMIVCVLSEDAKTLGLDHGTQKERKERNGKYP
jgi:hypothetical protein